MKSSPIKRNVKRKPPRYADFRVVILQRIGNDQKIMQLFRSFFSSIYRLQDSGWNHSAVL